MQFCTKPSKYNLSSMPTSPRPGKIETALKRSDEKHIPIDLLVWFLFKYHIN